MPDQQQMSLLASFQLLPSSHSSSPGNSPIKHQWQDFQKLIIPSWNTHRNFSAAHPRCSNAFTFCAAAQSDRLHSVEKLWQPHFKRTVVVEWCPRSRVTTSAVRPTPGRDFSCFSSVPPCKLWDELKGLNLLARKGACSMAYTLKIKAQRSFWNVGNHQIISCHIPQEVSPRTPLPKLPMSQDQRLSLLFIFVIDKPCKYSRVCRLSQVVKYTQNIHLSIQNEKLSPSL